MLTRLTIMVAECANFMSLYVAKEYYYDKYRGVFYSIFLYHYSFVSTEWLFYVTNHYKARDLSLLPSAMAMAIG